MMIDDIQFDSTQNEVIVSVGHLTPNGLCQIVENCSPRHVVVYEPNKEICDKYRVIERDHPRTISVVEKAVSGKSGLATFNKCKKQTQSTICFVEPRFYLTSYTVATVSMESVLVLNIDKFCNIDKLLINCEGSEFSIILDTDVQLFAKCKYVYVQFHHWMPQLSIDESEVSRCLSKLGHYFRIEKRSRKYGKYDLWRL